MLTSTDGRLSTRTSRWDFPEADDQQIKLTSGCGE